MQSENIGANNYLFLSGNVFIHRRFLNKKVGIWFTVYKLCTNFVMITCYPERKLSINKNNLAFANFIKSIVKLPGLNL